MVHAQTAAATAAASVAHVDTAAAATAVSVAHTRMALVALNERSERLKLPDNAILRQFMSQKTKTQSTETKQKTIADTQLGWQKGGEGREEGGKGREGRV